MNEDIEIVLQALTRLIVSNLSSKAGRQYFPTLDADSDDDHIKQRGDRIAKLRKLRQEFEDLVTGVV